MKTPAARVRLVLIALLGVSCGGAPIPDPAGFALCVARCPSPGFCAHGAEGWACITPQPTPYPCDPPCKAGETCEREGRCGGHDCFSCYPIPTPTPIPMGGTCGDEAGFNCVAGLECRLHTWKPNRIGTCQPPPTPMPSPTATPAPTVTPVPTATPQPTPTPCIPTTTVQRVCVDAPDKTPREFPFIERDPKNGGNPNCWTWATWQGFMIRNGYYTAGDPTEDGDAGSPPSAPGFWLNHDAQGVLVSLIRKSDGINVHPWHRTEHGTSVQFPYMEKRTVTNVCPSPSPSPSASPTPGPGGCPGLFQVGGMFLTAIDCGKKCRDEGYLGVRVNYTATELCREGDPGCVCDPARNRCEMPKQCQNPLGSDIYLTLAGHFTDDLCDANSDNPANCHHKPKANEAGVTLFISSPKRAGAWDPRATTNCVDVRENGTKQLQRSDGRCKAALEAAGR
jgi:hypothetical protein